MTVFQQKHQDADTHDRKFMNSTPVTTKLMEINEKEERWRHTVLARVRFVLFSRIRIKLIGMDDARKFAMKHC